MTYDEILSHFKVKTNNGRKAQCLCPAHADKQASLTISRENGKTLIYCHANCTTEKILDAVGLKMKDLFDDEPIYQTGEKWRAYVEKVTKKKIVDVYHYVDLSGKYAFTRLRLTDSEGKTFRYGIMDGDRITLGLNGRKREEIPAVFCESLEGLKKAIKEGKPIFYCEGEKDVKSVNFRGLTGITCGGADDWISSCATLFVGADVVILQDNDEAGENMTRQIMRDLRSVAKSVRVIVPTPEIPKGDISDFFKDHTVEDLEELLKRAEEKKDLDRFHHISETGKITGVFDNAIFQYLKTEKDLFVLGGVPYIYKDGAFRPDQSGAELKTMIRDLIYPEYVKAPTIKRIYDLFISDAGLQVTTEDLNLYPVSWINFRNGFYDPREKKIIPHDPKYRATNQIPHDFNPERGLKGSMVWDWLLNMLEPDDLEMLLQFSGLCLTRDTRQQKFLILNGEGGTGKSTIIRMIDRMIGSDNISNISLGQLTQRFSAFGLMGKLLNSCADLEIDALSDVSTLKKVLGEDTLSAEAKGKDAVSFKSYAKLIFSTNELPIVKAEKTNGFYRRLLILTMNKVPEKKDPNFFDKLSTEIDDFVWMSVKGLERLYQSGHIIESEGSIESVKRLRCDSDTVEAFLSARIEKDPEEKIKKSDLYRGYEDFCQEMERQSLTKQNFYRAMKTKGFGEIKTRYKGVDGTECFKGIKFRENLPFSSLQISLNDGTDDPNDSNPFLRKK